MDGWEKELQRLAGELHFTQRGTRLLARHLQVHLESLPLQNRRALYSQLLGSLHVDTARGNSRLVGGESEAAYSKGVGDGKAELLKILEETLGPLMKE